MVLLAHASTLLVQALSMTKAKLMSLAILQRFKPLLYSKSSQLRSRPTPLLSSRTPAVLSPALLAALTSTTPSQQLVTARQEVLDITWSETLGVLAGEIRAMLRSEQVPAQEFAASTNTSHTPPSKNERL